MQSVAGGRETHTQPQTRSDSPSRVAASPRSARGLARTYQPAAGHAPLLQSSSSCLLAAAAPVAALLPVTAGPQQAGAPARKRAGSPVFYICQTKENVQSLPLFLPRYSFVKGARKRSGEATRPRPRSRSPVLRFARPDPPGLLFRALIFPLYSVSSPWVPAY